MATTYTDASFGVRNIGDRTDSAGAAVPDVSGEEDRYAQVMFTQGVLRPVNSFLVASDTGWNVNVGSGGSKTDYAVVEGLTAGQGNYIVRLPNDLTVAINAADPSLDRIDEVYLVVQDNAYDSSSRALPRLAYRDGTAAGSPVAPGPDASWDAYMLLATIEVPGGSANSASATFTDERARAGLQLGGEEVLGRTAAGDTEVKAPSGKTVILKVGGATVGTLTSSGLTVTGNLSATGTIDGMDVSAHAHTGADGSSTVSHSDLDDLTTGDPHTQYLLESNFTKAAIDALNVDADTLDGINSSGFALSGHNHSGVYLGISSTAAAATKLATARTITLSGDVTGSTTFDGAANKTITTTVGNDSHTHDGRYYTESEANGRYYGPSSSAGRKLTISTSGPSGGSNGDIWLEY